MYSGLIFKISQKKCDNSVDFCKLGHIFKDFYYSKCIICMTSIIVIFGILRTLLKLITTFYHIELNSYCTYFIKYLSYVHTCIYFYHIMLLHISALNVTMSGKISHMLLFQTS